MGILDEDVARVREATDIVAVVTQHTQLRKVGQRWTGLCPFHNEKSPSFSVNPVEGLYYCFGCRASGDAITFVREIEHLDFVGAVEWLANKASITLRYTEKNEGESRKRIGRLHEVMDRAVDWYHDRLLNGPDAGAARRYLRSRGFDRDMVDTYRVGWAPAGWDELVKALGSEKVPRDLMIDCGVGMINKRDRLQDFFHNRVLFPIFDDQGRPVAFGGRKLPDAEGPKYQNSRENVLYNKSRTLYGLNWAKSDIVVSGEVVICEGYTDVIGFFRAGVPRAVATCGTALTEDHVRHLKRYTNRLVLAYDADEAGQAAAERVYEWERRHEVEVAVLALPPGDDPDELSRSDPEALQRAVATAQPFLGFRVSRALAAANLSTPEGRARAADAALEMVREHPSPLVRDQYLMEIADTCRIDVDQLRDQLARPAPPRREPEGRPARRAEGDPGPGDDGDPGPGGPGASAPVRPRERIRDNAEVEALRLLVGRSAEIAPRLHPILFDEGTPKRAYEALVSAGGLHQAIESADTQVSDLLARLAVEASAADPAEVIVRLVELAGHRALTGLEREARQSDDPLAYVDSMRWLKLRLDALRGDEPTMDSVDQLLAWLTEHATDLPC